MSWGNIKKSWSEKLVLWHFCSEKTAFFRARRMQNTAKTHYACLKLGSNWGKIDGFSAKK